MRIVDYTIDYLFDLDIDFAKYPLCKGNIVMLHNILEKGITYVVVTDGGTAIAVGSVMLYHPGVAGVYIIPSIDAHGKYKHAFIHGIFSLREELDNIARKYKLRRIETLTLDEEKHNRWMEYLGFLPEGKKEAYGVNGEDFIMWRKLWV